MGYQKAIIVVILFLSSSFRLLAEGSNTSYLTPKNIFPKVEAILKDRPADFFQHTVRRVGNKTITMEAFVSFEADWNKEKKIVQNISDYPKWVLPRINDRGGGEKFFILITTMNSDEKLPNHLNVGVALALPALKIPIHRGFDFEPIPSVDSNVFSMKVTTSAVQDSPVKDLTGYIHLFKNPQNPNQTWGYFQVAVVLNHWLVYESVPERLLQRETGDRIRIILENYQNFENLK